MAQHKDTYVLIVGKCQLERVHKALAAYDETNPLTPAEKEDFDLELLTDTIGSVLKEEPGTDMQYGVCL